MYGKNGRRGISLEEVDVPLAVVNSGNLSPPLPPHHHPIINRSCAKISTIETAISMGEWYSVDNHFHGIFLNPSSAEMTTYFN